MDISNMQQELDNLKVGDKIWTYITCQCCESGIFFIPDRDPIIFHPRSRVHDPVS
jgi:hypothetical protein